MLRLTICLLVAKTAFAANAYPIDNGGYTPVGPDTKLVFNFQHLRQDQPSQLEMREENIGKYMNRPITTTPMPIDNGDMSPMRPKHPLPYTDAQWTALQTAPEYDEPRVENWKNVPAPPNFPHWESLAVTKPDYHGYDQPIVVPEESGQWREPELHSRAALSHVRSTVPTYASREPVRHSPTGHPSSSRGHQEFNWNDMTTQTPTTMSSVNGPAVPGRNPPPPAPTLSPWSDGF